MASEDRINYRAVNKIDKYCNSHHAPTLGYGGDYERTHVAPKNLSGADRNNLSKAALEGVADWLETDAALEALYPYGERDTSDVLEALATHIRSQIRV